MLLRFNSVSGIFAGVFYVPIAECFYSFSELILGQFENFRSYCQYDIEKDFHLKNYWTIYRRGGVDFSITPDPALSDFSSEKPRSFIKGSQIKIIRLKARSGDLARSRSYGLNRSPRQENRTSQNAHLWSIDWATLILKAFLTWIPFGTSYVHFFFNLCHPTHHVTSLI